MRLIPFVAVAGLLASAPVQAEDWNQWRGPKRDAIVPGFAVPAKWPTALAKRWKVDVGIGHSSPVVSGNSVYIFARAGENEVLRCLALKDGKEIWRDQYPAAYEMNPAARSHGKGPKSTPVVAGGRVYTLGITGILSCYEAATGKRLWRKEFGTTFPQTSPLFGTVTSPLLEGDLLIAHVGGHNKGALMAFDARTGAVRWQFAGDGPAYTSPIAVTLDGVRQIVTQTQLRCVGVDARNGKPLWSVPFTTAYDQNSVTPAAVGETIIFGGLQKPTFALRPRRNGASWTTQKIWETRDVTMYMSSPVVIGKQIFGMSERRQGQMFLLDTATGKTLWVGEGRFGENAAVVAAGNQVMALTTEGELHVFARTPEKLEEIAHYRVADSATWASPAFAGNRLLVKDVDSLTLWEIR